MAIWLPIALALNLIYWVIFFYLLWRRRWNWAALAVGIFHMLFAMVVSVAPFRALLDPNYMNYGLGFVQFKGRAAALPAALILGWALAAAWIAVAGGKGRWMTLVAAGDILLALNMGGSILLRGSHNWKLQLGETVTITGVGGLFILLFFFTGPFVASAIWAANRSRTGGTIPPLIDDTQAERGDSEEDTKDVNGFWYSQSQA